MTVRKPQLVSVIPSFLTMTLGILVLIVAIQDAGAAMVVTPNSTWPGAPIFQTGTPANVQNRDGIGSGRVYQGQTFDVATEFKVTDIYMLLRPISNDRNVDYRLRVYPTTETTNFTGTPAGNPSFPPPNPGLGAALWTSPTWNGTLITGTLNADQVVKFSLTGADQFILTPVAGDNGYAFQTEYVSGGLTPFQQGYNQSNGIYADGRMYQPSFNGGSNYDVILAFEGAPVPEPSSFVLAALGLVGLGWFGLGRRRKG